MHIVLKYYRRELKASNLSYVAINSKKYAKQRLDNFEFS